MLATKFAQWDVPALETLSNSRVYSLKAKIEEGRKLDRDERNFVTHNVNSNSYFKNAIPLMGWKFDFSSVLKRFVVKQYGMIQEYYAVDKTSLKRIIYGRIDYMKELD